MIQLNPFSISGLLIIITCIPLLYLAYSVIDKRRPKIFFTHITFIFLWGVGSFIAGSNTQEDIALSIWKFAYIPVPLIAASFYQTVATLLRKENRIITIFVYAQAIIFIILGLSNNLFVYPQKMFGTLYFPKGNDFYLLAFCIWVIIIFSTHTLLVRRYNLIFKEQQKYIKFFAIATTIGYVGSLSNFLPKLGFEIYPYGNFLIPVHSVILTYILLKYKLLKIPTEIKKNIIYTFLASSISIFFLIFISAIERSAEFLFDYQSLAISIIFTFFIGLFFIPAKNKIQYFIDKIFFKGSQIEIAEQNEQLQKEVMKSERHKMLATLASSLAHEIRNPLTSMQTFTEFLPKKLNDKDFLEQFPVIMKTEIDRLNNLTNQLLDYAKPMPLTLTDIDLHSFLDKTLAFVGSQIKANNIVLTKTFTQNKIFIKADKQQMKQAFLNILLNAIEAMSEGGQLTISIQTSKNQHIEICMQDSGPGIPKEMLKKIWEPFYTSKAKGTGLGLSITKRIIEDHLGKIHISSTSKKGTTFKIRFPTI